MLNQDPHPGYCFFFHVRGTALSMHATNLDILSACFLRYLDMTGRRNATMGFFCMGDCEDVRGEQPEAVVVQERIFRYSRAAKIMDGPADSPLEKQKLGFDRT